MKRVCLLTGPPGSGKTTIIKEALAASGVRAGGFFTEEIRERGLRLGFRLVTLKGQSATLAQVGLESPYRVSKYGVDLEGLERLGVRALREALAEKEVVVVDEIGKMELLSPSFRQVVEEALGSDKKVLGTILLAPHPWADRVKVHPQVSLLVVSRVNHTQVLAQVQRWLQP